MKVLIVSCVFPPEPVISAQTSSELAEKLVERGHNVTVVVPYPNRPGGKLYPGYLRKLYQRESTTKGYNLVRCFSILSSDSSLISRFLENISFGFISAAFVLWANRFDVIYANTWPVIATGLLALVARIKRIALVISVQDLYPETLTAQGRIYDDHLVARLLRQIDSAVARSSKAVIVIGKTLAKVYQESRNIPIERLHLIPNWKDENSIVLLKRENHIRSEHQIPSNGFLCVYGGSISEGAGLEFLIQAFLQLVEEGHNLYLLIAGEGPNLNRCQALAAPYKGSRIFFRFPWKDCDTSPVLAAADLLVLPSQGNQSLASVPSKLITYMLAGRSILAVAHEESDVAAIIHEAGCGWVAAPSDLNAFASKIKEIALMAPVSLQQHGQAGREFALRNLTTKMNLPKVVKVLEDLRG